MGIDHEYHEPGKVFELRSKDVRRGEWYAVFVPPGSSEGDVIQPDESIVIFRAEDIASDWLGQGIVNTEVLRGNYMGVMLHPEEPVSFVGDYDDEDA